jgi:hypothetical protein
MQAAMEAMKRGVVIKGSGAGSTTAFIKFD